VNDDVADASLCEIADRIAARQISSLEVTEAAIRRAEALQSTLNTFISLDADGALDRARSIDRDIAKGTPVGPLAGVPLAHKDMFYRTGKVSTCGSKIRRDFVADRTSTVLARLERAGALYVGGLNMSEFAVVPFGTNVHYGNCHNPWDPERSAGGSSSGSGAATAARIVYGAFGSDTGGSVRIPAAMCGVVGIKPTQGRVSRYGLMPLSYSFDTAGPLARTVRDAARLFDVVAGHDKLDPTSHNRPTDSCETACGTDVAGLRVGIPRPYFYDETAPEVADAIAAATRTLEGIGATIVPVDVPSHDQINLIWAAALAAEAATIHRKWLRDRPDDYGALVRRRIEFELYQPATRYIEALTLRDGIVRDYCNMAFANCNVLLTPGTPITAPLLSDVDVGDSGNMPALVLLLSRCTRPISYLGLPAISVPCGFDSTGLPVSFQLIGRPFAEPTLCQVGHAYQQHTSWHERMPSLAAAPGLGVSESS
jgi:aspartyl-tRNA(Asn)/glutamyl-tRNA(Gln) amidotransferase subunit A